MIMNRLQEIVLDRSIQLLTTSKDNNIHSEPTNQFTTIPTNSAVAALATSITTATSISSNLGASGNPVNLSPSLNLNPLVAPQSPNAFLNLSQLINDSFAILSSDILSTTTASSSSSSVIHDEFGDISEYSQSNFTFSIGASTPVPTTSSTTTTLFTITSNTFSSLLPTVFELATNSSSSLPINLYDVNGDANHFDVVTTATNLSNGGSVTIPLSPTSLFPITGGSTGNSGTTTTIILEPDLRIHHPVLALLLGLICVVVVFGNALTMVSIYRERYLHTVTNYFVASLAAADCLVGAIVMPFSVVHEVMNKWWIFGQDWCDLWHSFDVLASSASILNLCVISLDRYWAITDPITYPSRMTPNKASLFIFGLWFCSSLISFPAIVYWRAVQKEPVEQYRCFFTEDVGYLVFSSTISFYGPLTVMVFTYYRIYVVASKQTRSLKLGVKQIEMSDFGDGGNTSAPGVDNYHSGFALRMHRGGGGHCQLNNHHHHHHSRTNTLTRDTSHYHSHGQLNTFQHQPKPQLAQNHNSSGAAIRVRSSLQATGGGNRLYKLRSSDNTATKQNSLESDSGSPSLHSITAQHHSHNHHQQPCSPSSPPDCAGGDLYPLPTVMDADSGYGHHPHHFHRSQRDLNNSSDSCCGINTGNGNARCSGLGNSNKATCSAASANNHKVNWSVGRRLAKLAKERKAAKTLGIVMGVFILCWLPFFVTNVLMGICPETCILEPDLVFSVVTWLGWINSAMNPIIYACWSKDFRRAFRKILCSCFISNQNLSYNRNRIYKAAHSRCNYYYKSKISHHNRNNDSFGSVITSTSIPAESTVKHCERTLAAKTTSVADNGKEKINGHNNKNINDNNNNNNNSNGNGKDNSDDVNIS